MTWRAPRTWGHEGVTAPMLNEHIRDNLTFLKSPPSVDYVGDASNLSTGSTTFGSVGANFTLALTTYGGDVLIHLYCNVEITVLGGGIYFDVAVDGTRIGTDDGIVCLNPMAAGEPGDTCISFTRLMTGLAAGNHTFDLQWKQAAGTTAIMLVGGGSASGRDVHPQFWVREIS